MEHVPHRKEAVLKSIRIVVQSIFWRSPITEELISRSALHPLYNAKTHFAGLTEWLKELISIDG